MIRIVIVQMVLIVLLNTSSRAQTNQIFNMMSPKLKQFMVSHPETSSTLSNVVLEAFSNRTVILYYYYAPPGDESASRAYHYYPGDSSVGLVIRENQIPVDEYFCLIFEMLNSEGEQRFQELKKQAESGAVTKSDFVTGILQQEFKAEMRTRNLFGKFNLSKMEIKDSYFYKELMNEPTNYEEALIYKENQSTNHGLIEYYGQEYDIIRGSAPQSNTVSKTTAIVSLVSTNK
jgi:hypothetical protein